MSAFQFALLAGAAITLIRAWEVPRAVLWVALGALSFIFSTAWGRVSSVDEDPLKMPTPEIVAGLVAKIVGAAAGAILSLIYVKPRSRWEFWRRGAGSLIGGVVFGPIAVDLLKLPATTESAVAGACAAAFCAWLVMGLVTRNFRDYDKK